MRIKLKIFKLGSIVLLGFLVIMLVTTLASPARAQAQDPGATAFLMNESRGGNSPGDHIDHKFSFTATANPPLPKPKLVFKGAENIEANGRQFSRYNFSIANRTAYSDRLFAASPELPPCGQNTNAARTWVHIYNKATNEVLNSFCGMKSSEALNEIWFAVEQGKTPPTEVFVVLQDRKTNTHVTSNPIALKTLGRNRVAF